LIAARFARVIMNYNGEDGLAGILRIHNDNVLPVPVTDSNILLDMDTPQDYQYLQEKLHMIDVPTTAECDVIMREIYAAPDALIDHSISVAKVALLIADEMNRHGFNIDKELLQSAALLHDLAKGKPAHAAESARIVREMGYTRVAELIVSHMDIVPGTGEEVSAAEVLYLADKLVSGDRVVTLQDRFARAVDRYGDKPGATGRITTRFENAASILARIEVRTGPLEVSGRISAGVSL